MKNNIITAICTLIIVGLCANVFNKYVQEQFEEQRTETKYIDKTLEEIQKDIQAIRAESTSAISRIEFADARDFILESNKKFTEYEVNMSRKSIQEFIDRLNSDMDRLTRLLNNSEHNYKGIQQQLEFLLKEIISIKEEEEIIDLLPVPENSNVQTYVVKESKDTQLIEDIPKEKCAIILDNDTKRSTKVIQRAVDRARKKGTYNISAFFNINSKGKAIDIDIQSDNTPPSNLKKAVQTYVSKLNFISDKLLSNCELNFNLNVT